MLTWANRTFFTTGPDNVASDYSYLWVPPALPDEGATSLSATALLQQPFAISPAEASNQANAPSTAIATAAASPSVSGQILYVAPGSPAISLTSVFTYDSTTTGFLIRDRYSAGGGYLTYTVNGQVQQLTPQILYGWGSGGLTANSSQPIPISQISNFKLVSPSSAGAF